MKNYEKAYKKALEAMSDIIPDENGLVHIRPSDIFSELEESEDERIRKTIIRFFKEQYSNETEMYDGSVTVGKAIAWLEKQGEKKEYTFKSLPRLLDMIEPTERAKAYCQKLIDTLIKEGYVPDAKVAGECLKQMNGEKVALATMDNQKINKSDDERIKNQIINFIEEYGNPIHCEWQKDWIAWLEKQAPKPTWTKEDESKVKEIIYFLDTAKVHYADTTALNDCIDWLNHLNKEQQ